MTERDYFVQTYQTEDAPYYPLFVNAEGGAKAWIDLPYAMKQHAPLRQEALEPLLARLQAILDEVVELHREGVE